MSIPANPQFIFLLQKSLWRRYRLRATGVEGRRWWSNVAELEL